MTRSVGFLVLLLLPGIAAAEDRWPAIKSTSSRVLWSAPTTQPRCSSPVFSPDGKSVAFFVNEPGGARLMWLSAADGKAIRAWKTDDPKANCSQIGFAPDGKTVAATVRYRIEGYPKAIPSLVVLYRAHPKGPLSTALTSQGVPIREFAFCGQGSTIAAATDAGIYTFRSDDPNLNQRVAEGAGTAENPSPFSSLAFSPKGDFLVAVGPNAGSNTFISASQGQGVVVFLDGDKPKRVDLSANTPYIAVSPDGKQVAAAVWTTSPVGVERPGGLMVWDVADLRAGNAAGRYVMDPKRFICGVHTYAGGVFWIDGKVCCLATELAPEPGQLYRRFGVWQVDAQAGEPVPQPKRLTIIGPMPKRVYPDPAGHGLVFWRYNADAGMFLLDERTGVCRRFDDSLSARNGMLSISPDFSRLAIAAGSQIVVHELSVEEK